MSPGPEPPRLEYVILLLTDRSAYTAYYHRRIFANEKLRVKYCLVKAGTSFISVPDHNRRRSVDCRENPEVLNEQGEKGETLNVERAVFLVVICRDECDQNGLSVYWAKSVVLHRDTNEGRK